MAQLAGWFSEAVEHVAASAQMAAAKGWEPPIFEHEDEPDWSTDAERAYRDEDDWPDVLIE